MIEPKRSPWSPALRALPPPMASVIADELWRPHRDLREPLGDAQCDGQLRIVDRDALVGILECDRCAFDMAIPLRELNPTRTEDW